MQWKSPWLTFPASQRLVVPQGSRQCLYPELLERFQGFSCTILHWAWWSCLVDMTFWECQVSKTMSASFFPLDLHHIMSVNKTLGSLTAILHRAYGLWYFKQVAASLYVKLHSKGLEFEDNNLPFPSPTLPSKKQLGNSSLGLRFNKSQGSPMIRQAKKAK